MTGPHHDIAIEDGIATLTMARPPANALDIAFLEELDSAVVELDRDRSWRSLIVTGSGNVFSAGVDLKILPTLEVPDQDRILDALNSFYLHLYELDRPVIAAINGHAVAGGMVTALCCDYRIAVEAGALFGLTEVRVGVAFPVTALEIAQAELSPHVARNWLMFGDTVDSTTALSQGVLDELVSTDAVIPRSMDKARELAAIPSLGYAGVKTQLRRPALERMRPSVTQGAEPLHGGWVSDQAKTAALKVLAGKG